MQESKARGLSKNKSPYLFIKRLFDLLFSLLGICVTFPIMLLIAVLIKIDSSGNIIFSQTRTGKNGKPFKMWKFRTMVSENDVTDFSVCDKTTNVGRFLRKTSLDELPQMFCILLGKMSFIGPRPWITDYYENMNEQQKHRCDVLPGMTGLAQAKGRNNISIFEKINFDLEYVEKFGLLQDIYIIFLTVKTVLLHTGADAGKETIKNELDELKKQKENA